jgi:hypothetical protein
MAGVDAPLRKQRQHRGDAGREQGGPRQFVLDILARRQVSVEEGAEFASRNGMEFCECSAKNGTNIENLFTTISQTIIDRIESGKINPSDESGGVKIGEFGPPAVKPVRKCC